MVGAAGGNVDAVVWQPRGSAFTTGSSDKSGLPLIGNPLVTEEAEAAASSRFVATKCHDGRFPTFTLLYLLLASSSFCLPLCFAFCVLLATLPLFRFSLFGVDLFNLAFDCLGSFHRL